MIPPPTVRWKSYRSYAGPVISSKVDGTPHINRLLAGGSHLSRATVLAWLVESGGRFGSVFSADGTGVTVGPIQWTLVLPKQLNAQGSLVSVLRHVEMIDATGAGEEGGAFSTHRQALWDALASYHLFVDCDDKPAIRDSRSGAFVLGRELRRIVTPPDGKVPKPPASGPPSTDWAIASRWARLFYGVFSSPLTFQMQIRLSEAYIAKGAGSRKVTRWGAGTKAPMDQVLFGKPLAAVRADELHPQFELACCVLWSHMVNAPAYARRALEQTLDLRSTRRTPVVSGDFSLQKRFASVLLQQLTKFKARWAPDVKYGRYQRTRTWAMSRPEIWPVSLFEGPQALMAKEGPQR